jgi:MFS family permease
MMNDINLKEIERKAFTSYFHDGMWEIYGGLILLGFGLTMYTGWEYMIVVFVAMAMVPLLIRKRIVLPRLGIVKFSPERQAKTKKSVLAATIALTFTALLGMVFFILFSTNTMPRWLDAWMSDYFLVFFGGMIAVLVVAAAFLVSVKRFYAYAALVFIAFYLSSMLRPDDLEDIPIVVAGGLVLLSGIVMLIRFLRNNPLPKEEIV